MAFPWQIINVPAKPYRKKLMQHIISSMFADSDAVPAGVALRRLNVITSSKKYSNGEAVRIMEHLVKAEFVSRDSGGNLLLNAAGSNLLGRHIKKEALKERGKNFLDRDQEKRGIIARVRKKSKRRFFAPVSNADSVILGSIFEHDPGAEFSKDSFCRWVYDLSYAEWNFVKSCKGKGCACPTEKVAHATVKRMLRRGIIEERILDNKVYIALTDGGAIYCGLKEPLSQEKTVKSKGEKYAQFLARMRGNFIPKVGLRGIKKFAKP